SVVYWGSSEGFSAERRSLLPSVGAYGIAAADLDGDRYKEVLISNYSDGSSLMQDSYLYWGSAEGYSVERRSLLPSMGATGNAIADLDADGLPDIVIANSSDGTTSEVPSWIYWGSGGWTTAERTELPTLGAEGVSLQDLDADGYTDVIISGGDPSGTSPVSYVFWGSTTRYSDGDHIELATVGSVGNAVSDLDGDGWKDLIFAGADTAQVWWGPSWPYGEPVSLPDSAHSFGISALALEQGL
ncbi:MAG TPA: VCBS repeat-containing protein, partial [Myxococcota bacterium]|nr:VCBS repeat-containing protein [Myxococcota bacterium]